MAVAGLPSPASLKAVTDALYWVPGTRSVNTALCKGPEVSVKPSRFNPTKSSLDTL